jgi:hypothetical protein
MTEISIIEQIHIMVEYNVSFYCFMYRHQNHF